MLVVKNMIKGFVNFGLFTIPNPPVFCVWISKTSAAGIKSSTAANDKRLSNELEA